MGTSTYSGTKAYFQNEELVPSGLFGMFGHGVEVPPPVPPPRSKEAEFRKKFRGIIPSPNEDAVGIQSFGQAGKTQREGVISLGTQPKFNPANARAKKAEERARKAEEKTKKAMAIAEKALAENKELHAKVERLEDQLRVRDETEKRQPKSQLTSNSVEQLTEPVVTGSVSGGAAAEQSTTVDTVSKSGFLANDSWIHALTAREQKLLEPKVMESVGKLLRLKGVVTYPKELGRAAKGPYSWMQETLIAPSGPLTSKELQTIPQWIFRRFDARLYQALQDAKKLAKKKSNQQFEFSNGQ